MKIIKRDIFPMLEKWMERKEAYAIKGPRQSGKTTILKILGEKLEKAGKKVVFLNFEDPDILEAFETNPKAYIKSFMKKEEKHYFLIDEYHYAKDPGKKLKLLYDTFENAKFIITGSSSLEIREAMAKFLVGRVFFFELLPFNFHEFLIAKNERLASVYENKNMNVREFLLNGKIEIEEDIFIKEFLPLFEEYVLFGGYPAVVLAEDIETKRMILKSIYDTYISKDVIEFLKFADAFKYRNVVRTLAAAIGNLINYNEICSSTQTYFKELKRIISMLSETYIIQLVPPFYKNPITELRKTPKVFFLDLGLRNYIVENFNPLQTRVDTGMLIENFVFLHFRNIFQEKLNYWRTIAKAEVDFVLRLKEEIVPVEVKYQIFKKPKITRSLRSFIKTYNTKKAIVITKDFWGLKKINDCKILFAPAFYI